MLRRVVLRAFPMANVRRLLSSGGKSAADNSFALQQPLQQQNQQRQNAFTDALKYVVSTAVGAGAGLGVLAYYSPAKEMYEDKKTLLQREIAKSKLKMEEENTYVERKELVKQLEKLMLLNIEDEQSYTIVYGCKGVGKSTAVHNAFANRDAVVKVDVDSCLTKGELIKRLAETILRRNLKTGESVSVTDLNEAVAKFQRRPTIIFDVEIGTDHEQFDGLNAIRSLAKGLTKTCNCIIVLSDANAIIAFGKDRYREKYLFVGEMTDDEAKGYLQKLTKRANMEQFTEEKLRFIFAKLGKNPALLNKLVAKIRKGATLDEFTEHIYMRVEKDLRGFALKEMLRALKANPEGVSAKTLVGKKDGVVDLSNANQVAPFLKNSNAVLYRLELDRYEMMSTVHRKALETYVIQDGTDVQTK